MRSAVPLMTEEKKLRLPMRYFSVFPVHQRSPGWTNTHSSYSKSSSTTLKPENWRKGKDICTSTMMSFLSQGLSFGSGHLSPRQKNSDMGGHLHSLFIKPTNSVKWAVKYSKFLQWNVKQNLYRTIMQVNPQITYSWITQCSVKIAYCQVTMLIFISMSHLG